MSLITWKFWGFLFFLQKRCNSNLLTGHLFGSCFTAQKPDVFFGHLLVFFSSASWLVATTLVKTLQQRMIYQWPWADGMIQRGVFPEIFPWLCLERYEAKSSYGRTARGPCRETWECSWNILAPVYCLYKSPWTPKTNKTVHRKNNSHSLLASF